MRARVLILFFLSFFFSTAFFFSQLSTTTQAQEPPCPKKQIGDANCDDLVNDADYSIWRCELLGGNICQATGGLNTDRTADFDLDESVTINDFEIWRQNLETVTTEH